MCPSYGGRCGSEIIAGFSKEAILYSGRGSSKLGRHRFAQIGSLARVIHRGKVRYSVQGAGGNTEANWRMALIKKPRVSLPPRLTSTNRGLILANKIPGSSNFSASACNALTATVGAAIPTSPYEGCPVSDLGCLSSGQPSKVTSAPSFLTLRAYRETSSSLIAQLQGDSSSLLKAAQVVSILSATGGAFWRPLASQAWTCTHLPRSSRN